jgi:hypothetical protein
MNEEQLRKLRQFYHSLLGQKRLFDGISGTTDHYPVMILEREIQQLLSEFPDIVPQLNIHEFHSLSHGRRSYYDANGIKAYLNMVMGRLEIEIEQTTTSPVTEKKEFYFITNGDLRKIIARDYQEIQRAYISECWKSVIILCGSVIEAILTDVLLSNETNAKKAKSSPNKPDITRWDLSDLIKVSVELCVVGSGVEKLSHSIREYRNLVHPGNEIRNKLMFDAEEARIAVEVLNIVHRDLAK